MKLGAFKKFMYMFVRDARRGLAAAIACFRMVIVNHKPAGLLLKHKFRNLALVIYAVTSSITT